MSDTKKGKISRRSFIKLSGAVAATVAAASPYQVLYALTKEQGPAADGIREVFSACDMCFNKCGLIAQVENDVIKKLDPNPKSLKSRGMLCARGNAGVKQLYDPDRLKYPLLRKGARGEGKWQRLSWVEALDHAQNSLTKSGKNTPGADFCSWPVRICSPHLYTSLQRPTGPIMLFPMNPTVCSAGTGPFWTPMGLCRLRMY